MCEIKSLLILYFRSNVNLITLRYSVNWNPSISDLKLLVISYSIWNWTII